MLTGCDTPIRNHKLKKLSQRLESKELSRSEALEIRASLDSIGLDSLNDAERQLLAFLSIKAEDKGFVMHKDSTATVYEGVKDYFSSHHEGMYPEVLYYGGRIYADIGDSQTAIRHYADALDAIGEDNGKLELRGKILSQSGHLLNSLRLYGPALERMEEAIRIDSLLKDTLNMVYDLQLSAGIANRQGNYAGARRYARRALPLSEYLDSATSAETRMYMAYAAHKSGNLEEAQRLIRNVTEQVSEIAWNEAVPYAVGIYIDAGVLDSAFMLAQKLTESPDPLNRHIAYHFLLSKKLRHLLDPDSISIYTDRYYREVDRQLDQNANQAALLQHSLYNYTLHEKKRREAERKQQVLAYCICGLVTAAALVVSILLGIKFRQQKQITYLQQRIDDMRQFKERNKVNLSTEKDLNDPTMSSESRERLRDKLNKEIGEFNDGVKSERKDHVDESILRSEVYATLQSFIKEKRCIKESDALWERLEEVVTKASPGFLTDLLILGGGRVTGIDIQTAILIKCGIKPSQMATLLNIAPSSVVSRRSTLANKIFGKKISTRIIDEMIRRFL